MYVKTFMSCVFEIHMLYKWACWNTNNENLLDIYYKIYVLSFLVFKIKISVKTILFEKNINNMYEFRNNILLTPFKFMQLNLLISFQERYRAYHKNKRKWWHKVLCIIISSISFTNGWSSMH